MMARNAHLPNYIHFFRLSLTLVPMARVPAPQLPHMQKNYLASLPSSHFPLVILLFLGHPQAQLVLWLVSCSGITTALHRSVALEKMAALDSGFYANLPH